MIPAALYPLGGGLALTFTDVAWSDIQSAFRSVTSETWATIRGGNGTSSTSGAISAKLGTVSSSTTANEYNIIRRVMCIFNVSGAGAITVVPGSYVDLNLSNTGDGFGDGANLDITAVALTNSGGAIVAADYQQVSDTKYSDASPVLADGTAKLRLNTAGLSALQAAIDAAGYFYFSARVSYDADNSEPTWASGTSSGFRVQRNSSTKLVYATAA